MKITALVENNTKRDDLLVEHGVSFLIEAGNKKILFDVGSTDKFLKNAEGLSISLDDIDCVALSHGHYDHVGGLEYLQNKTVYVHPDIFIPKYDLENGECEFAGFPRAREYYQNDFIEIKETLALYPNIKLHVDFKKPEISSFRLKVKNDYVPDLFTDELALSVNTPQGLVIVTGCAHSGIINIIEKVLADSDNKNIYALLGGFHLASLSQEATEEIAKKIENYNIKKIGISHCTGDKLAGCLTKAEVFDFNTGDLFGC